MKKISGFKNCQIYLEGQGIVTTSLLIEDGIITKIDPNINDDNLLSFDQSTIIVPGFIDQHIHGAAGSDAMDGTYQDLEKIAKAIASEGTTAFLATTMTQSPDNIIKALTNVNDYLTQNPQEGAEVLGVHLEGPYISTDYVGAQPIEYVSYPSIEDFKKYQEASGNHIRIVTLAPEVSGSLEFIKYLKDQKIVPSIGHTNATYADVTKAVLAGASNVTHTYNAQRSIHHREIGTVGSAMLIDQLNCELICDFIHVSPPAISLVIKNKPADKITLITDAMRAKHMPDGISELGGQVVIVKDGQARLENGTLAGSVLKMNQAVKNVASLPNVSLTSALDFATINPALNLEVDKLMGSIKVGKYANFAILDADFNVVMTIRQGMVIYQK